MRNILILGLVLISFARGYSQNTLNAFTAKADAFLHLYVKEGKVNYKAINKNLEQLENILASITSVNVPLDQENVYKAFWINAYNLSVISGVAKNYPVTSPMAIKGFFDEVNYTLAGELLTLNDIENKKLRAVYPNAEYHFVLVCAALSCPPLINKAYKPENLNELLNQQTKLALNHPDFVKVNANEHTVSLSEILKWYKKDFLQNHASLLDFVNTYRDDKIPANFKISFYPYNWQLNEYEGNLALTSVSDTNLPVQIKSNILEYSPSKLMQRGQWDLKIFNNLYTQTRAIDETGKVSKGLDRESYFTSTFEVYTGLSKNARINIGLIINLKSNIGNNYKALDVLKFKTTHGVSRAALSAFAPSIKISPFKNANNFSIQSSFYFPVFNDVNGSFYLDKRSYIWENKFYYDRTFGQDNFQLFGELDLAYYFGKKSDYANPTINSNERYANNSLGVPVSLFFSYFPTQLFTLYIYGQYFSLIDLGNNFSQQYALTGGGIKTQVTNNLNLELSSSYFFWGRSTGLGVTYNFGLRYIL